jgi:hypothetical protein
MEIYSIDNVSPLNIYFSTTPVRSAPNSKSTHRMKPFFGWAMIDSGASSCFINKNLVETYRIPLLKKEKPK